MTRNTDAWGVPKPATESKGSGDAWTRDAAKSGRTKAGRAAAATIEATPNRFAPVARIQPVRTRDAWGAPMPERGMADAEFAEAVRVAQDAIFAKASPATDEASAVRRVNSVTSAVRVGCTSDAQFIEALQRAVHWNHGPLPAQPKSEVRRGPGSKTIVVKEGQI